MTRSAATWPAAVSLRSARLVHGAPRSATVLAVFPTALYLQAGGHADVLPVVTRDGLRLPTALMVAARLPTVGWGAQPGDPVMVGGGDVRLPGVTVRAVRTWTPRPAPRAADGVCGPDGPDGADGSEGVDGFDGFDGFDSGHLATLPLPWRPPARAVTELLLHGDRTPAGLAGRVGTLVGAGPGLTPSGDDVLCGVLLGLRLHRRGTPALVDELWHAVEPRLATTTSLSASLLREAADGYAAAPVTRLLEVLASLGSSRRAEQGTVADAVRAVLAIGHTSGADLLGGLAGCLDALAAPDLVPASTATPVPVIPRSLP
jgi:hypothetical protein